MYAALRSSHRTRGRARRKIRCCCCCSRGRARRVPGTGRRSCRGESPSTSSCSRRRRGRRRPSPRSRPPRSAPTATRSRPPTSRSTCPPRSRPAARCCEGGGAGLCWYRLLLRAGQPRAQAAGCAGTTELRRVTTAAEQERRCTANAMAMLVHLVVGRVSDYTGIFVSVLRAAPRMNTTVTTVRYTSAGGAVLLTTRLDTPHHCAHIAKARPLVGRLAFSF